MWKKFHQTLTLECSTYHFCLLQTPVETFRTADIQTFETFLWKESTSPKKGANFSHADVIPAFLLQTCNVTPLLSHLHQAISSVMEHDFIFCQFLSTEVPKLYRHFALNHTAGPFWKLLQGAENVHRNSQCVEFRASLHGNHHILSGKEIKFKLISTAWASIVGLFY